MLTIVLVHGAFADASSWKGVVERLQKEGHTVVAPANPLRGLAADTAYIASVVELRDRSAAADEGDLLQIGVTAASGPTDDSGEPQRKSPHKEETWQPSSSTRRRRSPPSRAG
jgi:hypothetical protein